MKTVVSERGHRVGRTYEARLRYQLNTLEHSDKYSFGLDMDDIRKLEMSFQKLCPVYVKKGQARYRIVSHVRNQRITFVYDTQLACLITCRPAPRPGRHGVVFVDGERLQ